MMLLAHKSAIKPLDILALPLIAVFMSACLPPPSTGGGSVVSFSPPGDTYSVGQNVTISTNTSPSAIYYTLDGSPATSADNVYGGSVFVDGANCTNTTLSVLLSGGSNDGYQTSAIYTFDDGTCTVQDYANDDMLRDFMDYEGITRQRLKCENNGCSDPGLGQLGDTWTITDAQGDTVSWLTVQEGFGGKSTFTYNSYDYTVTGGEVDNGGEGLIVTAGSIVGHFNASANGATNTESEGSTLMISGKGWAGEIEDHVTVTGGNKTGGYYIVRCTAADPSVGQACAPGNASMKYKVSREAGQTVLTCTTCGGSSEPSGSGNYLIKNDGSGKCLREDNSGADISAVACVAEDETQQWQLTEINGNYQLESVSAPGNCMAGLTWAGDVGMEACSSNDTNLWTVENYGSNPNYPHRLHNANYNYCIYTDGNLTFASQSNCGLPGSEATRRFGIYLNGDFGSAPWTP